MLPTVFFSHPSSTYKDKKYPHLRVKKPGQVHSTKRHQLWSFDPRVVAGRGLRFSPRKLGKMNPFWQAYFFRWVGLKPPNQLWKWLIFRLALKDLRRFLYPAALLLRCFQVSLPQQDIGITQDGGHVFCFGNSSVWMVKKQPPKNYMDILWNLILWNLILFSTVHYVLTIWYIYTYIYT